MKENNTLLNEEKEGKMLEAAVTKFTAESTMENLIEILDILEDSCVWIPCIAKMSEADQAKIKSLISEKKDNPEDLIGITFVTHDETRFAPDILESGGKFFFPVFSSEEAMGEYGNNFSKIQMSIKEAIILARNNDKNVEGIVLNAFSEPFILDKKIWDIFENVESQHE